MAVSWGQRRALGRRYSTDPALDAELARLAYQYSLAPGREARSQQESQFSRSQSQQESQYSRGLAARESEFNRSYALQEQQARAQQEEFAASLAQRQAEYEQSMAMAQRQYEESVRQAKTQEEIARAQLKLQQEQQAAAIRLQEEQTAAQREAAIYGTAGNLAMLGGMYYLGKPAAAGAAEGGGLISGIKDFAGQAYDTVSGLWGGGTTGMAQQAATAPLNSGMYGGGIESGYGFGGPQYIDTAMGAGAPGAAGGETAILPTVGQQTSSITGIPGAYDVAGVGSDVYGAVPGMTTNYGAIQQSAVDAGLAAGADVGLGYGEAIGSGISAGADVGMGAGATGMSGAAAAGGATLGSVLGTAVPWVGAATIGMPIFQNVMEKGWQDLAGIEPGSSNVIAQANTISGQEFHRPIEAVTETITGWDVPTWVEGIFNPGGWALGALGLCFLGGTLVEMEDGEQKAVEDVRIGDAMLDGGLVTGIGAHLILCGLYDYEGVKVTGSHAVRENGVWKRVQDSEKGIPVDTPDAVCVYILDNMNHRIVANEVMFSDFTEVDGSENMLPEDRIERLNEQETMCRGTSTLSYDSPSAARLSA